MGDVVIVAYRPKPGQAEALLALVRNHVPDLRRLGLATDRPAQLLHAADGTIVEIFEWQSGAIARAHEMPEIHAMWHAYADACDYIPLRDLPEAATLFATFAPLDA